MTFVPAKSDIKSWGCIEVVAGLIDAPAGDHQIPGHTHNLHCVLPSNRSISKKIASNRTNILDISTKPTLLYSPYSPPSDEPIYSFLAPLMAELAFLTMLFIFPLIAVCVMRNK